MRSLIHLYGEHHYYVIYYETGSYRKSGGIEFSTCTIRVLFVCLKLRMDELFLLGSRSTVHRWNRDSLSFPMTYRTPAADIMLPSFCQITSLHSTIHSYGGVIMTACMTAVTPVNHTGGYQNSALYCKRPAHQDSFRLAVNFRMKIGSLSSP